MKIRKNFKLLEYKHIIYHVEMRDLEICLVEYVNFAKIKEIMSFTKFLNAFVKPRNLNFS